MYGQATQVKLAVSPALLGRPKPAVQTQSVGLVDAWLSVVMLGAQAWQSSLVRPGAKNPNPHRSQEDPPCPGLHTHCADELERGCRVRSLGPQA